MAKVKHKNQSAKFHNSRMEFKSSHLSRAKTRDRRIFSTARKSILAIIILATLTVILTILLSYFTNPERIVKSKIPAIATDYYENYFYPEITADSTKPLDEIMSRYVTTGFARVTLRQLLLFDGERHAEAAAVLATYCDTNDTFVQFFPESPFGKTDYRVDYHYSCTF